MIKSDDVLKIEGIRFVLIFLMFSCNFKLAKLSIKKKRRLEKIKTKIGTKVDEFVKMCIYAEKVHFIKPLKYQIVTKMHHII